MQRAASERSSRCLKVVRGWIQLRTQIKRQRHAFRRRCTPHPRCSATLIFACIRREECNHLDRLKSSGGGWRGDRLWSRDWWVRIWRCKIRLQTVINHLWWERGKKVNIAVYIRGWIVKGRVWDHAALSCFNLIADLILVSSALALEVALYFRSYWNFDIISERHKIVDLI